MSVRLDLSGTANGLEDVRWGNSRSRTQRNLSGYLGRVTSSPFVQTFGGDTKVIGMFGPRNRVPDVNRYRVAVHGNLCCILPHPRGHVCLTRNRYHDLWCYQGGFDGTIVLLLESPHEKEYRLAHNGQVLRPIAPAQGRTGRRIEKHLEHILNAECNSDVRRLIKNNSRVVIANPIQFQSSLWVIHKGKLQGWETLRSAVWRTLWKVSQIQNDFCNRLQSYNPDVVLNCCTENLRQKVSTLLCRTGFQNKTFAGDHPSTWNVPLFTRI